MKKLLLLCCLNLANYIQAQQVIFSNTTVSPQKKRLIGGLEFPGIVGNTYVINEYNGGGAVFDGGIRDIIHSFDVNTLQKVDERLLNKQTGSFKDDDYYNITTLELNNNLYAFFLNIKDKNIYPLYYQRHNAERKLIKEEKTTLQIDKTKLREWNNKRDNAMLAGSSIEFAKAQDGKSLLAATISATTDKHNSTLSVVQWDGEMNPVFQGDYNIPLAKWMHFQKTIMGRMETGSFEEGKVLGLSDDANGYIYVLVQSADINNKDNENLYHIYQLSKTDKKLLKHYYKEFSGNMIPRSVRLQRNPDGKVMVVATGFEGEDKTRNSYKVNTCYLGEFDNSGNLQKVLGNRLDMALLELFDYSRDVQQRKKEYIRELDLRSVNKSKDGKLYLVWEQVVEEEVEGAKYTHTYYTSANMLVQQFAPNGKVNWQQPVFKKQVSKDMGPGRYGGAGIFFIDDNLYVFYADDPKNAKRDIKDRDIDKFSVVKFGNKDLGGFFGLQFGDKGLVKRTYLPWPEDKSGFAISMASIKALQPGVFLATARKLHQGTFAFTEEDFTVIKFTF